jgi:hypothetical protein
MFQTSDLSMARQRAVVLDELRRLLPRIEGQRKALPLGLAALDSHLPEGGLACGALHEVVPETEGATAAALGFIAAILARIFSPPPCGEGLGVGVERDCTSVDASASPYDPPPPPFLPSPTRGEGKDHPGDADLRPPSAWPPSWSWPQHTRSRSDPADPGPDRAP